MLKTVFVILIVYGRSGCGGAQADPGACRPGWVQMADSCLLFRETYSATWSQASLECHNMAATLLRFETSQELTAFAAIAQSRPGVDGWWTDLNQIGHQGIWVWGDNERAFDEELTWNSEPDDVKHAENCVAINYMGKLSDEMCSRRKGFLCESARNPNCTSGWLWSPNSCYFVSYNLDSFEMQSWQAARNVCASQNATLFSIDSVSELQFLTQFLPFAQTKEFRWWTGLSDLQQEGVYLLPNGSPAPASVLQWETFPNNLSSVELCGIVHSNGHVSHGDCDVPIPFVCRLDSSAESVLISEQLGCSGLWWRAGRKCYYFRNNNTVTQTEARTFCQRLGADLIHVETQNEKEWLSLQTMGMKASHFWTGLHRASHGATNFLWEDNSSPDPLLVQWNSEPNDFDGSEDCAAISQDGVYNDLGCLSRAAFICRVDLEVTACPKGWVTPSADSDACYYFSHPTNDALATFWEARDKCVQLAGNNPSAYLFGVTSQAEQQFVLSQVRALPATAAVWWTDLTDIAEEGVWQFYDSFLGSPNMTLIQWNSEPNNQGGNEDCTVMYYEGRYNDIACDATSNVLCEKPAVLHGAGMTETASSAVVVAGFLAAVMSLFG